jgi:hypothetical protein
MIKTLRKSRSSCACGDKACAIPHGLCHCGCGKKTEISRETRTVYRAFKGRPKMFLPYHHVRSFRGEWAHEVDPLILHLALGNGRYAVIDADDHLKVQGLIYHGHLERGKWYAARGITTLANGVKSRDFIRLHWDILQKPPAGFVVDHINGDGLDNRKINLRICSNKDNGHNHRLHSRNTSGYSGVLFDERRQMWAVTIGVDNRKIYLGRFRKNQKDKAIACRLEAEKKYYGEFAPKRGA